MIPYVMLCVEGGISGADETMNLYGKPMLGPQSRVSPVDMPQTMSKMQTIVLPPTTMQAKKSPNQGSAATELPSFNISRARSSNGFRLSWYRMI